MQTPEDSLDSFPSAELLGPELASAFAAKGYTELTTVQRAVLAPELRGRDLRISSQTGSGKTIAIGLAMREHLTAQEGDVQGPRALVVAPTRELAKQVELELGWLFAPLGAKVLSLVGGSSLRDERRGLAAKPTIVVGTPGRLLDHQRKGALVTESIRTVVLDEADRMLDMGFREDIESLFAALPEERRTHLVSATFPREVRALAAKVQQDFATVEGTPLGKANTDIEHIIHLCHSTERLAAVINLLLESQLEEASSGEAAGSTLIFARTRADVADVTRELNRAGFRVAALSGDLEQAARNRALDAFKSGMLDALVATDVAARGIDAQNVARVIHGDPPSDPDTYTHRSGRTGRAGRKGKSLLLVAPAGFERVQRLLSRAKVNFDVKPLPTREELLEAQDARWFRELTEEQSEILPNDSSWALAKRLVREGDVTRALGRLLHYARTSGGRAEPRTLEPVAPPRTRQRVGRFEERRPAFDRSSDYTPRERTARHEEGPRQARTLPPRNAEPRDEHTSGGGHNEEWTTFHVTWGEAHGADARRLVAMACRRGGIAGRDIGAIRVGRQSSTIDVAANVAEDFARAAQKPDPRDPRIEFSRGAPPRARDGERSRREYTDGPPRPRREYGDAPARAERPRRDAGERHEEREPRAARAERPQRDGDAPKKPDFVIERRPARERRPQETDERPRKPAAGDAKKPFAKKPFAGKTSAGGAKKPFAKSGSASAKKKADAPPRRKPRA